MTVCIAAQCSITERDKRRDAVVCATDTTLSRQFTSSDFHRKFDRIGGKWLAMLAADDLAHADALITEVRSTLLPVERGDFNRVLYALGTARDNLRLRLAAEKALPPGMTIERFYREGKAILPDLAFSVILNGLTSFQLACDLLVVGFDADGDTHLATVGQKGPEPHDREGFQAIGSGWPSAIGILSAYNRVPIDDWRLTAYEVFAAKRSSERAAGVGRTTFLALLTGDGLRFISTGDLDKLYEEFGPLPTKKHWSELENGLKAATLDKWADGSEIPRYPWQDESA